MPQQARGERQTPNGGMQNTPVADTWHFEVQFSTAQLADFGQGKPVLMMLP